MQRRRFVRRVLAVAAGAAGVLAARKPAAAEGYDASKHTYGMGVQVDKCIGCGRCVEACKTENGVPREPFFMRTWVEQYTIRQNGDVVVRNIDNPLDAVPAPAQVREVMRSFYVPKLCNQCDHPPCVQVCPVGATFKTEDGVILVDEHRCIGCRYCIAGCPYGSRSFNWQDPRPFITTGIKPDYPTRMKGVVEKCTFCTERLVKGLPPACVEVCNKVAGPGTMAFGDIRDPDSEVARMLKDGFSIRRKPGLGTEPQIFYLV